MSFLPYFFVNISNIKSQMKRVGIKCLNILEVH